ncbi:Sugar transporter family/Major Facilitator Superfamily [Novymonas esmeraldas]|uniref:Sugar transporter family/Major Facilitator Superfamily n=1 Tax=Novymonas esmeraldas TaxID=1808958 RepID=A0AAW0ERT5_9TRYP
MSVSAALLSRKGDGEGAADDRAASPDSLDAALVDVANANDVDDVDAMEDSEWAALQNKNVVRVLGFCFVDGASHSIWCQEAFQVLVRKLGGDTAVGWMSAASGVTQMISALVAGYAGDRLQRQTVLRIGSIAGFLTIACTMLGATHRSLSVLYISQGIYGIYTGVTATVTEAIFADSVETGRRAFVYNLKWISQTLCTCVGLLTTVGVLVYLGNHWEESALVKTMLVGLCLHPVAMAALWSLRDKYTLVEEEEEEGVNGAAPTARIEVGDTAAAAAAAVQTSATAAEDPLSGTHREEHGGGSARAADDPLQPPPARALISSPVTASPRGEASSARSSMASARSRGDDGRRRVQRQLELAAEAAWLELHADVAAADSWCGAAVCAVRFGVRLPFTWEAVPYLVCLVDFLVAVGSGMTLRYISLFFIENKKATPVSLLTAALMISPLQATIAHVVQRCGDLYVGRLPSTLVARLIGTVLLLLMGTTDLPIDVLLPIYIIRNALMNCTRGVTRSVIMDCVKKESRAKWSAFESFSSFTWAGSAVIGGYIAAAHGYQATFTITSIFHFFSLAVLVPGAIGARPVEAELMRANRNRSRTSCARVTGVVSVALVLGSVAFVALRCAIARHGW